ncbi:MAG TPA: hypothetical protein VMI35_13345 [Puia sp.]|nr:hypothetical protein [Puia sp.]
MYISVRHLKNNLGVDEQLARFFVDRKIPENNIFWKGRLLYVGRGNGYVSIPVYYDLLHRIGLPTDLLLSEGHLQFMERVMHFAILVEFNQMSFADQLEAIKHLLSERVKQKEFLEELLAYLEQPVLKPMGRLGMPVPALNRADVFLFVLCDLPLTAQQLSLAIKYWYALHTSYLLMDDIYDYKFDKQERAESSVIELGDGPAGFEKALSLIDENCKTLQEVNPVLANHFQEMMADLKDLIP